MIRRMRKTAQVSGLNLGLRMGAGALAGGVTGRYVTPGLMGYDDNPAAVNMSTILDAALGAGMAGIPGHYWKEKVSTGKFAPAMALAVSADQIPPVAMDLVTRSVDAAKDVANRPTVKDQIGQALTSNTAKGVGAGAGVAALAAMLTGLLRQRRDAERRSSTPRSGMIAHDFGRFVLPAALAGGLIRHYQEQKPEKDVSHWYD